jgi:CheY-like chemotaxis protein
MNKNTIVLVDDDLTINYFHKRLLKIYFDQEFIQTCFNGKQAIDTLLSLNESLDKDDNVTVLLDLNMPVMNGWEFLAEFHSFKAELKFNCSIYIITSSINPEDKKHYEDMQSFRDRIITVKIPYVLDYNTECKILKNKFGAGTIDATCAWAWNTHQPLHAHFMGPSTSEMLHICVQTSHYLLCV